MYSAQLNLDHKELTLLFGDKSNFKGLTALIANWICFIVSMYVTHLIFGLNASLAFLLYLPLSFIIGCCLKGFDNLTHEATHQNIFKTKALHQRLQFSYAFMVLKTVNDEREHHLRHHRNYRFTRNNNPQASHQQDHEIENWTNALRLLILQYTFKEIFYQMILHFKSRSLLTKRILFWCFILMAVTLTQSWTLFTFGYLIPLLFWLPFLRFVTQTCKHNNVNPELNFGTSRSHIGWFPQLLLHPHNDAFYQMHYFAPTIPFYNLKKAYYYALNDPQMNFDLAETTPTWQTVLQNYNLTSQKIGA